MNDKPLEPPASVKFDDADVSISEELRVRAMHPIRNSREVDIERALEKSFEEQLSIYLKHIRYLPDNHE